jgi:hypothetical protein
VHPLSPPVSSLPGLKIGPVSLGNFRYLLIKNYLVSLNDWRNNSWSIGINSAKNTGSFAHHS